MMKDKGGSFLIPEDMDSKKKQKDREKRGQVTFAEVEQYCDLPIESLIQLLKSPDSKDRTIAATILGTRQYTHSVMPLCQALEIENSLYSRIAMSEALGKIGEPAVVLLVSLLGKIGSNQEKDLPIKYFDKRSYPLARDITARTLIKIGTPSLHDLIKKIEQGDGFATQQAIDAVGGIVDKTDDKQALETMIKALDEYNSNRITAWKVVRAFSGMRFIEVLEPLITAYEKSIEPAIRWEAIRSIGQVGIYTPAVEDILRRAMNDENAEVRKASKIAIGQIIKEQIGD